jgi:hypothetical protein
MRWSYRQEHMIITRTYLNSHLLGAPREYVLHGLNPGLNWASCWSSFSSKFLICPGPTSILLFAPTDRVSHLTPPLLSGRLLTNVQVNNIATLHDTHGHTYIHHIGIAILLLFYTSSNLLGRLAGPDPSRLIHICTVQMYSHMYVDLEFWSSCTYKSVYYYWRPPLSYDIFSCPPWKFQQSLLNCLILLKSKRRRSGVRGSHESSLTQKKFSAFLKKPSHQIVHVLKHSSAVLR